MFQNKNSLLLLLLGAFLLNGFAFSDDLKLSYQLEYEKKYQDAFKAVQKLADSDSHHYLAHLRTAYLAYVLGNSAVSSKYYQKAMVIAPDAIEPALGLMLPQLAMGNYTQVEMTAKAIFNKDPKNYTARSRLAWSYYLGARYSDAAKIYEDIVKDYPSDTEMMLGLANSLLAQKKKPEALKYYQMMDVILPGDLRAAEGIKLCQAK
jgi:tetratricopeptide (TPR) repeat protein